MSKEYTQAVLDLIEENPQTMSLAMVTSAYLHHVNPDIATEPLDDSLSQDANDALKIVVTALHSLESTQKLPESESSQDTVDVLEDNKARFVLMTVAAQILEETRESAEPFREIDPDGSLAEAYTIGGDTE